MFLNENMRAHSTNFADFATLLKAGQPRRKGESALLDIIPEPERRN